MGEVLFMAVYLGIILILYVSAFVNYGKKTKQVYWAYVAALAVISGIRYYVGTDYGIQVNYYNWTVEGWTKDWLEVGFRAYINVVDRVFGSFQMFIFIASVFVVFSFGYGIYKNVEEKYWFFTLGLFVTSTIYFATMNLERQYIAIAFLIHAFERLKSARYIQTAALTLLAISFHSSAICFLAFYLVYLGSRIIKKKDIYAGLNILMMISVAGIVVDIRSFIKLIADYIIPERYMGYLSSRFFVARDWDSVLKFIVPNIIWFLWFFWQRNEEKKTPMHTYMIGFCIWLVINNFFYGVNVFLRIGMYFEWFLLYAIPQIVDMGRDAKTRASFKAGFLLYFLALTSYSILYQKGHGVLPYQTFFSFGNYW